MLEGLIRSVGGPVRDVKEVQCRTTGCWIVFTHHASLIFLDQAERTERIRAMEQQIQKTMEAMYRHSPRLGETSVLSVVRCQMRRLPLRTSKITWGR